MLLEILTLPRRGTQNLYRKLLRLQCDECKKIFERRWQREKSERSTHFCSCKCSYSYMSKNVELHKKISEITKMSMSSSEVRKNFLEGISRRNENPNFRMKISEGVRRSLAQDPDRPKRVGKTLQEMYSDPDYYEKFVESQNSPELKKFRSDLAKQRWSERANIESMSKKIKSSWASGVTGHGSPLWIARQSAAQRSIWDDEYRLTRSGSNNPMSGVFNPWWEPWMTKKQCLSWWSNAIRKLSGDQCLICGEKENLEAHHIAPRSTHPDLALDLRNGIALCFRCHHGADNPESVHALLRKDSNKYESLMKELIARRELMLCESNNYEMIKKTILEET